MKIENILSSYVEAALWTSSDDNDETLDSTYYWEDFAPETQGAMREDVQRFIDQAGTLLIEAELSESQIGHDFWLTRNGHGAGFWDRNLGEIGDKLSDICRNLGEAYLYIGDDGQIHCA